MLVFLLHLILESRNYITDFVYTVLNIVLGT